VNSEIPDITDPPQRSSISNGGPGIARIIAAICITAVLGIAMVLFGTLVLEDYGWMLFVGLPVVLGAAPVLLIGPSRGISIWTSLVSAISSVSLVFVVLFGTGVEGMICLLMAAPIWVPLAVVGGVLGYALVGLLREVGFTAMRFFIVLAVLQPTLMGVECMTNPEPSIYPVTTSLIINAPPEIVWQEVVEFDDLPEPEHWLFKTGVAYPTHARIEGQGVGAVRYCEFTTGPFVEPIEVWDEPRLLQFSVTENPAPMKEWSLFSQAHPPHLDGFLVSEKGQFELIPMSNSRTRLVGTTWYQHGMSPDPYWRVMSDYIIRQIHARVLEHIKISAEVVNGSSSS